MPTNHGSIHTSTRGHRQEHVAFLPLDYSKNTQNLGPFSLSQPSAILNRGPTLTLAGKTYKRRGASWQSPSLNSRKSKL